MPILYLSLVFGLLLAYNNSFAQPSSLVVDSLAQRAKSSDSPLEKSQLYHQLARIQLGIDFEKAEAYERLALKHCPANAHKQLGNCYGVFAAIYAQTDRSIQALSYADSALYHYQLAEDSLGLAILYNTRGAIYIQLQQLEEGAANLYKSLKINEQRGDTSMALSGLLNLLSIYQSTGDIEKMWATSEEILALAIKIGDQKMQAFAYQAKGAASFNLFRLDSALAYYQQSVPAFEAVQYEHQVALAYSDIANIYALLKRPQLALQAAEQAKTRVQYLHSKKDSITLYLNLAHTYHAVGRYAQSIAISKTLLQDAYAVEDLFLQEQVLNRLAKGMVKIGDFEAAYYYETERQVLADSLVNMDKQQKLLELEKQYQTEKVLQQNQILSQEKDLEKARADQNSLLFYFSLIAIFLVGIIAFLWVRQNKATATRLTNQLQHRLLRNQMNPHFIFNALTAIQNFVHHNTPLRAGEYLAAFAQLMRAILEHSTKEYITLRAEIQWLDNYLQLQLLRFNNSFVYKIELDPAIDVDNLLLPPMLTQPFIENALEHGLQTIDYKGELQVDIKITNNLLLISVADNGIGLEASKASSNQPHQSLAIKITKERLRFLNKKEGKKIFFDMKSLPTKGSIVSFSLPLKYKY